LANTVSGLTVAKERPQELLKWVDIISHSCTLEQHLESCKSGIINNVKAGNNKNQLIWLIQNYYIVYDSHEQNSKRVVIAMALGHG
jgi:hypothetical protein